MELYYNNKVTIKNESMFYIFEIEIKNPEKNTIRRIKNHKIGELINNHDNINCSIDKIKFSIFDLNNPQKKIVIKKKFSNLIENNIILSTNEIILHLTKQNNNLICNYKFL